MSVFIQQVMNALTIGCLYALIAIGYTQVYGILRLINFAHADVFMMAMYFAFYFMAGGVLPWYIAILLVIIATALLGMLIEKTAYKPLRKAPRISLLISAIGVSYLLENLATVIFTGIPKSFPSVPYLQEVMIFGDFRIQRLVIFVVGIMIILVAALLFFVNKTKTGIAMRAVSKDFETAKLMGININRTISATFAIGSGLAAVGAFFWGLKYSQIQPYVGAMPGIKCFIAAVIGGIGNIKGAVVGGIILGLMEILLVFFIPDLSGYRDAFAFIALILILILKPTGLFGEEIADKA